MNNRPLRSVFLLAAELQFRAMSEPYFEYTDPSAYSCDNIATASIGKHGIRFWQKHTPETNFYQRYFKPNHITWQNAEWWKCLRNGKWDHESRILALLLAAELLRR